jgi:hypothetical protein
MCLAAALLKRAEVDQKFEFVLSTKVGRLLVTNRPGRQLRETAPKNDLDSGWHGASSVPGIFSTTATTRSCAASMIVSIDWGCRK